ncbi:MAG: hypothetical protein ACK4MF_07710 [Hyphomicrobiaceae bacterium]
MIKHLATIAVALFATGASAHAMCGGMMGATGNAAPSGLSMCARPAAGTAETGSHQGMKMGGGMRIAGGCCCGCCGGGGAQGARQGNMCGGGMMMNAQPNDHTRDPLLSDPMWNQKPTEK